MRLSEDVQQSSAAVSSFVHQPSVRTVLFLDETLPQQIVEIPVETLKIQVGPVHYPHFVRRTQSRL